MKFSFESHGVVSMSYWQGVGTAYTIYDEVFTGIGITEYDAAEDAIEMLCQSMTVPPAVLARMEEEAQAMDAQCNVCEHCDCAYDGSCDGIEENPDCDMTFVVALFIKE